MKKGRDLVYDPAKVKELRMKVIMASLEVINGGKDVTKGWSEYKKQLILKYAPRVLPVLFAGRNDDKDLIPQPLLDVLHNDRNQKDIPTEKTD